MLPGVPVPARARPQTAWGALCRRPRGRKEKRLERRQAGQPQSVPGASASTAHRPRGRAGGRVLRVRAHRKEDSLVLSESQGLHPSVRAGLSSWLADFCHFCCCRKNKPYTIAAPHNARKAGSFVEVHGLLTCGVATGPRPDRREEGRGACAAALSPRRHDGVVRAQSTAVDGRCTQKLNV